ncbi:MAG: NUDIX domain-containing protein [Oscillospiraceae bacterium]|nr:NUDIX domain-containing protein [Oscillospiraceae bacterium]
MKHNDLTVPVEEGLLNIRVGAIILRGGRVLMTTNDGVDYLYSVGGRVQFGETAEEAAVREVWEETGVHMNVDRLGFIHENFFIGDSPRKRDQEVHEISFFYYMDVPEDFEPVCASFADGDKQERLEWVDPAAETRTFYPAFFKEELQHPCDTVKRIVTREW